ncbi:MAG TPA: hypothetical protein VHT75_01185 [Acidimicrobiales bacterium]|nr:hypothetical protein [Acidimicrobiales bacterium]
MTDAAVDVAPYAAALADGIEAALPGWVVRSVTRFVPELADQAAEAGRQAAADVGPRVRHLLESDIDEQRTTPLAIVRRHALRYPTAVLGAAGVPAVGRDEGAEELFPDDPYDLVPASFADLDPELADTGLRWGAAKAFEHKRRHGGRQ